MAPELSMIRKRAPTQTGVSKDQRVLLGDVTWEQYWAVRKALDHIRRLRMTYLNGTLELVTISEWHDFVNRCFARLLEFYAFERDVEILPFGSTTWRNKRRKVALESDSCWMVDERKSLPDFALEVVVTSGGLNKRAAYRRLGVREVLFWKKGRFLLFRLQGKKYAPVTRSEFFPDLDLVIIGKALEAMTETSRSHLEILREFRDALRRS
jgi:Uma2 family endonuclease